MTRPNTPPPLLQPSLEPATAASDQAHRPAPGQVGPPRLAVDARERPAPPPLAAWPSYPDGGPAIKARTEAPTITGNPVADADAIPAPAAPHKEPPQTASHPARTSRPFVIATVGFVCGVAFWHAVGFWGLVHEAVFSGPRFQETPVYRADRSSASPAVAYQPSDPAGFASQTGLPGAAPGSSPADFPAAAAATADASAAEVDVPAANGPLRSQPVRTQRITTGSITRNEPASAAEAPVNPQAAPLAAPQASASEALDSASADEAINWLPAISTEP